MSGGALASLIASLAMLAWIAHGFSQRGVPIGKTVKMALVWVGIFAVGLLLYSLFAADRPVTRSPVSTSNLV